MLVLDVEASGTEANLHSVVSIGAIDLANPERRFYVECRIWPGAKVMSGALAVNGFTEAEIIDVSKLTEAEAIQQFIEWTKHLDNHTILGQNPSFDRDMVRHACLRAGIAFDLPYRTLDTHTMAFMHMTQRGANIPFDEQRRRTDLNLNTILQYCGVPAEPDPHNALTGAMCHAEVASRLLYNQKLLPEFEDCEIPW